MKEYLELFAVFFKCGISTFGGGYAMLPILQRELVAKRHWCTDEEITDYYAVGQCTPGVIAVNVSTFIGMKKKGWGGAVFSTLGEVFPSILIITAIAALITGFADNVYVARALCGIRAAVCGLITVTLINLIRKNVKNLFALAMAVVALVATAVFDLSPVLVVLFTAACGILRMVILAKGKKEDKK